ncbi:MAG: BlaI/MecI/CopY family transcriptional regulator [Phaeodactylibacter sp.]|nr:BlaI/MecI/CopY family transcriptional regulator [Phaeodactylibacter sp.]
MIRLNEKEEQVMQALWRLERAFVKEIVAELEDPKPPVTTVSSIVRKLEEEGLVAHEEFGRTHRYYPVLKKKDYRKSFLRQMMADYFGGSTEQLLSHFIKEENEDPARLKELLDRIKNKEDAD